MLLKGQPLGIDIKSRPGWLDQMFWQIYQKLMLSGILSSGNLCLIHHLKLFWPYGASRASYRKDAKIQHDSFLILKTPLTPWYPVKKGSFRHTCELVRLGRYFRQFWYDPCRMYVWNPREVHGIPWWGGQRHQQRPCRNPHHQHRYLKSGL